MQWPVWRIYSFLCILLLGVPSFQACKHAYDKPGDNYASLDDFYKQQSIPTQQFIINPTRDTVVTARNGVRLYFYTGAFSNMYTRDVISTPVRISFKQVHTVADIILANKPTQTGHDILETAGCFYFNAHQNIHAPAEEAPELEINEGKVRIDWPSTGKPDAAMQLFNGRVTETLTSYYTWEYLSKDKLVADNENNIYSLYPTHLQWINIDKFSKDSTGIRSEISLKLPEGFDKSNTISFMVFHNAKSVLSCKSFFFELIPANKKVTLVTIGVKDSKLFIAEKELVTPAINTEVEVKMKLSTKSGLQVMLSKL